jgi:hypothetical protein
MGRSQPGEVGLAHPRQPNEPQTFPTCSLTHLGWVSFTLLDAGAVCMAPLPAHVIGLVAFCLEAGPGGV